MATIREPTAHDLPALTEIYNHYVLHSHATFVSEPVTPEQRQRWFEGYLRSGRHVLLVLESDSGVQGYAGAGPYRNDPGFEHTVETSIYLASSATSRGYGKSLYNALFDRLKEGGFHRALAAIVLPNDPSVALHRKFGFEEIGVFSEYGRKWDRYWSSLWMQKAL